jgi:hypothetical protein
VLELISSNERFSFAGRPVPIASYHFDPGALRLALALDRLIVDADAGDSGADAFADQPPHGHDAAVSGVAIHHDGELDGLRDPSRHLHALGHRHRANIGQTGIGPDHTAGADEAGLAAGLLHDARMGGSRRMQHGEHLVLAVYELLQTCRFLTHDRIFSSFVAFRRPPSRMRKQQCRAGPSRRPAAKLKACRPRRRRGTWAAKHTASKTSNERYAAAAS